MFLQNSVLSIMLERCWLRAWDTHQCSSPKEEKTHRSSPGSAAVSIHRLILHYMTPGPKGSLQVGIGSGGRPQGDMPSMGVWADRVEGSVVRSPSEAVSGPQSRQSEA